MLILGGCGYGGPGRRISTKRRCSCSVKRGVGVAGTPLGAEIARKPGTAQEESGRGLGGEVDEVGATGEVRPEHPDGGNLESTHVEEWERGHPGRFVPIYLDVR
jgi:hypothetical protein